MKAHELATLLMNDPDADVLIASFLVGHEPAPLEVTDIPNNAEIHAWIVQPKSGKRVTDLMP